MHELSWTICSTVLNSYAPHSLYLLRSAVMLQLLVYCASYWMKHVISICRGFVHNFCLQFHCCGDLNIWTLYNHFCQQVSLQLQYVPPWTCFVGVFLDVTEIWNSTKLDDIRSNVCQGWTKLASGIQYIICDV